LTLGEDDRQLEDDDAEKKKNIDFSEFCSVFEEIVVLFGGVDAEKSDYPDSTNA